MHCYYAPPGAATGRSERAGPSENASAKSRARRSLSTSAAYGGNAPPRPSTRRASCTISSSSRVQPGATYLFFSSASSGRGCAPHAVRRASRSRCRCIWTTPGGRSGGPARGSASRRRWYRAVSDAVGRVEPRPARDGGRRLAGSGRARGLGSGRGPDLGSRALKGWLPLNTPQRIYNPDVRVDPTHFR